MVIGVGQPVIQLISSTTRHAQTRAADIPGYACFGLTLTAWNTYGVRLVAAREAGVLKRWRATPLPRWCYFLGRIVACVIVAAIAEVATVLAAVLLYHTHLQLVRLARRRWPRSSWAGCPAAAAATALSAAIPTTEAAAPTLMLIYFPAIVISGVIGSISEPHWLYTLATYLPAQPLISAVTSALGHPPGTPLLPVRDVVVLAAWAAAGLATAVVVFRWEPHRPMLPSATAPLTPIFAAGGYPRAESMAPRAWVIA